MKWLLLLRWVYISSMVILLLPWAGCEFGNKSNVKISDLPQGGLGEQGSHLSLAEFIEASKSHDFPVLSDSASDISYVYQYDGFLPDYRLEIHFQVPCETAIEPFNLQSGQYHFWQSVEEKGEVKIVHYTEVLI